MDFQPEGSGWMSLLLSLPLSARLNKRAEQLTGFLSDFDYDISHYSQPESQG